MDAETQPPTSKGRCRAELRVISARKGRGGIQTRCFCQSDEHAANREARKK